MCTKRIFDKKWLTVREASAYLGVSKKFIRDMVVDGLHYYKVRNTCFISKAELDEYISSHKVI